jgi:DNA-binding response OmpR family regulator/HPt (histidine-containing phosphotransfer) domain-containing protein
MKILLVEDDDLLVSTLAITLAAHNYIVETATDGETGLHYAQSIEFDLLVLDIELPGLDGISLCRQLRQSGYKGAVLLLTVKSDCQHKIAGLDAGADDYVVKPCSTDELLARIRALLRRSQEVASPVLQWHALQLDPSNCLVSFASQPVALSPKEYGLLELFMRHPHRIFSSSQLLERLWGFHETPGEETVRTHIKRLRRKLKQAGAEEVIENIYGLGYRLKELSPLTPLVLSKHASKALSLQSAARTAATAALPKFSGVIAAHLQVIEEAIAALRMEDLSTDLQRQAKQAAHKLAGSLGMFGLPLGSRLSRQLEACWQASPSTRDIASMETLITQLRRTLVDCLPSLEIARSERLPGMKATPMPSRSPSSEERSGESAVGSSPTTASPWLLAVTQDQAWVAAVQQKAGQTLEVVAVADISQAILQLAQRSPAALLVAVSALSQHETYLAVLKTLAQGYPELPLLVLMDDDRFETRLAIARHCSCVFLVGTTPAEQVVTTVIETLAQRHPASLRLLAVDDDPLILTTLEYQLPRWGIQVTTLRDPCQFWTVLGATRPDVLMLDVAMPQIDGTELCQILRSDPTWAGLPILFLSAYRDARIIQQIYSVGADDYIPKPFTEPELVTRIFNRLERSRLQQRIIAAPHLSEAAPQQLARRDLDRDLRLARRYHQPYCLAMVSWGWTSPPTAAASLASPDLALPLMAALRGMLRQEDVVAQFQSEIVTLGLYGLNQVQASHRLSAIAEQLDSYIRPLLAGQGTGFSLVVGTAVAPEAGTDLPALQYSAEAEIQQKLDNKDLKRPNLLIQNA